MNFPDMRTVILISALINITCLLVMILLWIQSRKRFDGMNYLVYDFSFQTIAFFLIVLRGHIPDWASIVLANALLMTGALLGYMGLLKFVGEKRNQLPNYIYLILAVFIHSYFTFIDPNLTARNINVSFGLFIFFIQCAWLMLYRVPAYEKPLTKAVGMVFLFYCVICITRIINFMTSTHPVNDFFQSRPFDTMTIIAFQFSLILLTYSLILMVNKRLNIDMAKQEEMFNKVFRSSPYAILLTRLKDGKIIETNDGFTNITGYLDTEVKDKTSLELRLWANPEDRKFLIASLQQGDRVTDLEFMFRKKSGDILTGLYSADIITIHDEQYILSSINDITESRRAQEALIKSEERYRSILDNLLEGCQIIGFDWRYIYLNNVAARHGRKNKSELIGKKQTEMYPGIENTQVFALEKKCMEERTTHHIENEFLFPDGSKGWFDLRIQPVPEGIFILSNDITERKQAEELFQKWNNELEKRAETKTKELRDTQLALLNLVDDLNQSAKEISSTNRLLEIINKELASFSYSVSHDLRAPLRSIDGFSNVLLEDYGDQLDEEGKNHLSRIRRATQHMGQLIDDMLNLSRVTQSEFSLQNFNLSTMVRNIAYKNQQESSLEGLILDIQENVFVHADPHLMNIVMTNLLDNAFKYTGKCEHPHIEFGCDFIDGECVIFVRDNGAGYDKKYADKLFGPFQRLHRNDEFPGTGIGLATVKRIIERHGGRIWADSEPGRGATFFFTIPGKNRENTGRERFDG